MAKAIVVMLAAFLLTEAISTGKSEPACLLQSTFASGDLSVDAAKVIEAAEEAREVLFKSEVMEDTTAEELMARSKTRSRSCKAHLLYLNRKTLGLEGAHNVSNKNIDEVVKSFISKQSGSQDACSSQLLEAKHQLNQIHEYVMDLIMQVNTTETALLALNNEMTNKVKDLKDLDEWRLEELEKCEKKKKEYIEMYTKLSAEMEEMKQIASPGVAMDVKTGTVVSTAGAVGLLQMQSYPSAKDMKELDFLLRGTQTAAKQFLQCMAHNSGHKERMSQLQKFVAVNSFGDSEVEDTEDLINATEDTEELIDAPEEPQTSLLDPKPKMVKDPDSDGKKCKYKPGKKNDGDDRAFRLKNAAATLEACTKKCAEDAECVAMSAIFGQWCIGCKVDELTTKHKGATAFKKVFGDDEPPLEIKPFTPTDVPVEELPTESHVDPVESYNCKTRELWSKEKKKWCCEKENLGCKYNCLTRGLWAPEKKKWCCKNKGLGCPETGGPDPEPETGGPDPKPGEKYDCKTRELWSKDKKRWCCKKKGLGCPLEIKPITIDIPEEKLPTAKPTEDPTEITIDPYPEPQINLPKPKPITGTIPYPEPQINLPKPKPITGTIDIPMTMAPTEKPIEDPGSLGGGDGFEGGSASASGAATAGEGESTEDDLTIEDLREKAKRDENDQAAMDAAKAIKNGAATPEQCAAEKKVLEETYVKTYVELSRLKDEYNELANSTACEDNVESLYKSKKTPIQEDIDQLIKDIDQKVKDLENLRPRLERATKSEKELRKHIATLTEECAQLPETVSNLDKVRDAIEALSKCPGLSRVQFSLPKWTGTYVSLKLRGKTMTDDQQDEAMNAACAEAVKGTRAAETAEIEEQTVEGIPETNTADLPLVGTCPNCAGDEAPDFESGHKRICFRPGKDLNHEAKSTNCASGKKAVLCVTDREDIREYTAEQVDLTR